MAQQKKRIHYAWFVLIAIIIMMGFLRGGVNSGMGLFLSPISQDLGFGIGSLSIMYSVSALVGAVWKPIAGKLLQKYSIRMITGISVCVHALCFAAMGLMHQLWGWYSFVGLMALGAAFTTQLVGPVLINKWFKEKNGTAMGIMMAAVGLFGAILQPTTAAVISKFGWSAGYICLGLVSFVVVLPVVLLLIRDNPEDKGLKAYGAEEAEKKQEASGRQAVDPSMIPGITSSRALKTPAFYCVFLFMFFICGIASFASHVPTLAVDSQFTTQVGGNGMSFWMIGTFVGSLLFGMLADKLGAKKSALLAMCFGFVAVLILIFFRQHLAGYYGALVFYGFLASTMGTLGPLIVSSIFGYKDFGTIFGFMVTAINVASMVLVPVYGFVYDATKTYQYVLYMILGFLVACVLCLLIAFKNGEKLKSEF